MIMRTILLNNTLALLLTETHILSSSQCKNTKLYYLILQRSIYVNLVTRVNIIAQQNALSGVLDAWIYIHRESNLPITKRAPLIRNSYIQPYLYRIIDRRFYCRLMRRVIEKPRARIARATRDKAMKREIYFIARRWRNSRATVAN